MTGKELTQWLTADALHLFLVDLRHVLTQKNEHIQKTHPAHQRQGLHNAKQNDRHDPGN